MGGALLVAAPATYYALKKASGTLLGGSIEAGRRFTDIDAKLLGGAALYGAGLAAGGITPSPAWPPSSAPPPPPPTPCGRPPSWRRARRWPRRWRRE